MKIIYSHGEKSLSTHRSKKKTQLWKKTELFSHSSDRSSRLRAVNGTNRWFASDTHCKVISCGGLSIYQPPSITWFIKFIAYWFWLHVTHRYSYWDFIYCDLPLLCRWHANYLPVKATDPVRLSSPHDVKNWMLQIFLRLNSNKTKVAVVGSQNTATQILPAALLCAGFEQHTTKLVQSRFYRLRYIFKIEPILSVKDTESILHAFISFRINYCNSLFIYVSAKSPLIGCRLNRTQPPDFLREVTTLSLS